MEKVDQLLKEIIRDVQENEVDEKELAALQRSFVVTRREVVNDYATAEWKKYLMGALRDGETLEDLGSLRGNLVFDYSGRFEGGLSGVFGHGAMWCLVNAG